jgi:hypothetical protein
MIDVTGRGSERADLRYNCYDFPLFRAETVSRERMQSLRVEQFGRGGLYAEPQFVERARNRALAAIRAATCKYEYVKHDSGKTRWAAIRSMCWLLVLAGTLVACSDNDRRVVLSDETGSRTLVYQFGKGFIPQARVPDDVPVLIHSGVQAISDAVKENDFLTVQTLQRALKENDFRSVERATVEFRFRQLERGAK